jgi:hypothetical protein
MTPKNDTTADQAIAAKQARILRELVKVTLSELSPDPEHRARAAAAFEAALNEEMGP